jgi:hypothetical protein
MSMSQRHEQYKFLYDFKFKSYVFPPYSLSTKGELSQLSLSLNAFIKTNISILFLNKSIVNIFYD